MKSNMIVELKGLVSNMKAEIARVEEIIATLEAVEEVEAMTIDDSIVGLTPKEAVTVAFEAIQDKLISALSIEEFNNEITEDMVNELVHSLKDQYLVDSNGDIDHATGNLIVELECSTKELLSLAQNIESAQDNEYLYYSIKTAVASYKLDKSNESKDDYYDLLDAWELYSNKKQELANEKNAFSIFVDSLAKENALY